MSGLQKDAALWRALISLEGLSVGDAFGEQVFALTPDLYLRYFAMRSLPEARPGTWRYTDGTQMALTLVEALRRSRSIDQDMLAEGFALRYEPSRAYGENLQRTQRALRAGGTSRRSARFSGHDPYGNDVALRAAPLGAYFADDLRCVVSQARLSAEVTHSHPDAIAGAIAVAVCSALAWQCREAGERPTHAELLERVLTWVPASRIHQRLQSARDLAPNASVLSAASILGANSQLSALDAVPFVLWCAGQFLDNYEEALWQTAHGLGDVDTSCAMVGGIVVLFTGFEQIPVRWVENREELPDWVIKDT